MGKLDKLYLYTICIYHEHKVSEHAVPRTTTPTTSTDSQLHRCTRTGEGKHIYTFKTNTLQLIVLKLFLKVPSILVD